MIEYSYHKNSILGRPIYHIGYSFTKIYNCTLLFQLLQRGCICHPGQIFDFLKQKTAVNTRLLYQQRYSKMVPLTGLEPVRMFSPRDFKSLVSADSTTAAHCDFTK